MYLHSLYLPQILEHILHEIYTYMHDMLDMYVSV